MNPELLEIIENIKLIEQDLQAFFAAEHPEGGLFWSDTQCLAQVRDGANRMLAAIQDWR